MTVVSTSSRSETRRRARHAGAGRARASLGVDRSANGEPPFSYRYDPGSLTFEEPEGVTFWDQISAGFAVSAQVNPIFADHQEVPNSFDTIGHIDLPAGSYAISAKVNLISSTGDTYSSVECRLIAEDDVDEGNLGDTDGDNLRGEITLQLAHEFGSPGAASVACTDNESSEDPTYNGAAWNNLRITAIRLGSLTSGPA